MSFLPRPPVRLWVIALLGALVFVAVDTVVRSRHIERLSGRYGEMVDPPAVDPTSPTGYALGRRSMSYPEAGLDSLHWVMQTQAMFATGTWRIRHVDYDNAPAGREVHWASPFHWWLGMLAWCGHGLTGEPVGLAVERAALYADPMLLGLVLLTLVPLAARRFGPTAATFMAVGMVAAFPFYLFFMPAYADHHGLAEAGALMVVLFLLAGGGGCVRVSDVGAGAGDFSEWLPTPRAARRWFAASAVAGGIGLWISAAGLVPVLIGVGAGALGAGWLVRKPASPQSWRLEPTLWRWWGVVGGATSFAAYLLEYFPSHLGFRLEVNHPLYALAWLGAGELLCRVTRAFTGGGAAFKSGEKVGWALAAAAVALLPGVILFTKSATFIVADPFVWRLHVQAITEFESMASYLAGRSFSLGLLANCLPALLVVPAGGLALSRGVPRWGKALLVLALMPALLFLVMTGAQVRWWGMAYALLFAVLAVQFALLERPGAGRGAARAWRLGCALVFLPGAIQAVRAIGLGTEITQDDIRSLAERDLAHWLRLRLGRDPAVVISSPATTTTLIYYGGLRGLGTLYWENREGLKHAAAIFAAPSPDQAQALIRRYGVTHIVLVSWSPFTEDYVRLYLGLAGGEPLPANAFIQGLLHGQGVPPWLRLIPYQLPGHPALKGETVLVFEVTPAQAPDAKAVHMTAYLVEMGRMDLAARMEPVLAGFPHSLPALAMLAYVQGKSGEAGALAATVDRILADQPPARDLPLEDRIRLATVLAAGGRADFAQSQLEQGLAELDERSLRRLTTGTLRDLLILGERLGVQIPDPRLRRLAAELLPPSMRGNS
jgi:hypothetical protein